MGWLFNREELIALREREVHCHILPGVDDGFRSEKESIIAVERLHKAGVREIVFTPHMNPDVYPDMHEAELKRVYAEFDPKLAHLGIKTSLAAEYMVVKDFEYRATDKELLAYPDGSILIEQSYYFPSQNLEDAVFALTSNGYKPILAHPERYLYMAGSLHEFEKLHDMGCRFQLNWLSLTGMYGDASMRILKHILNKGWYSFVATDLHSLHQLDRIERIKIPKKSLQLLPK